MLLQTNHAGFPKAHFFSFFARPKGGVVADGGFNKLPVNFLTRS